MTTVKQEGTKKVLLATYAIIGLLVFSAAQTAIVGYLNDKHFGAIDLALERPEQPTPNQTSLDFRHPR